MKRFILLAIAGCTLSMLTSAQIFTRIKDINPGSASSIPQPHLSIRFADVNGWLFFVANNGSNGYELWKTNGTAANTFMVKDIMPGSAGSDPLSITTLNNNAIFIASSPANGSEIWISDGSETGTQLLKDIYPGSNSGPIGSHLVKCGSQLFFTANDGPHGFELWKSDGSSEGTRMIKDIYPGVSSSMPGSLTDVNGTLFFYANTSQGMELWKSDGTEEGTMLVKDINPGPGSSVPDRLTAIGSKLYFYANDGMQGTEPWVSNGTPDGTFILKDINHGLGSSNANGFVELDGRVYFSADDGLSGSELWCTDGTSSNTNIFRDIRPGSMSSSPGNFMKMGDAVYFLATGAGPAGKALWKTNGTDAGTIMIEDLWPTTENGTFSKGIVANDKLFFIINDPVTGYENLWVSNGTEPGTLRILQNINDGTPGPHWLLMSGTRLYIDINDNINGRELWNADLSLTVALPVSLSAFNARLQGNDGLLQWTTEAELNFSKFVIERSLDGRQFSAIASVAFLDDPRSRKHYSYADRMITSLPCDRVYYRLRMEDSNGSFSYSRMVALNIKSDESFMLLYPNPTGAALQITVTVSKNDWLTCIIYNQAGQPVHSSSFPVSQGSNQAMIDCTKFAPGIFTIQLSGAQTKIVRSFFKE